MCSSRHARSLMRHLKSMAYEHWASERLCLLQRIKEQLPQLKEALEDRGLRGVDVQCPYTKRVQGETFGEQLQYLAG